MTIDEIFNAYTNSIKSKSSPPEWITSTPKSGLTRNITIEDWNSVIEDISHIASDCDTIDKFIRKYKEYIETKFKEYVTSEYFEEQFENLNNIFNTVYLKANAAYDLATSNSILIKRPTVYFESEFKQIYYTLIYSAEMDSSSPDKIKKGDIFILTEESQPDFVVLDDGGYVFNDAITVRDGYIPSPEVGKKYFIADTYTVIAIESGVQKPATDSALNANSTNPVQNKVVTAKFSEIEQKLTNVSGKSNVLLYTIDNETYIADFVNTFLQDNYDNLNSGDILVVRYYYDEFYKDYIYILRQESPMAMKTWHLLIVYDTGATSGGNITVEQEVNDSENSVSSKAVKTFGETLKTKRVTLTDATEALLLEDNTVYNGEGNPINNLSIDYPTTEFMCELIFTVGETFTYYFPLGTRYVGKAPDFKNGETWELSIHNGIIASGKVVSE